MLLIDEPYLSDFLLDTIRRNQYPLIDTPNARALLPEDDLPWIRTQEAIEIMQQQAPYPLYSVSENGLDWIAQHLPESELARQIRSFKDKYEFRKLIQHLFPDFFFRSLRLEELHQLAPDELPYPFVVKPAVGFFSIGVHIVRDPRDWERVKAELQPEQLKSIFPESVLNTQRFILETFISGEEYAVDYYYDEKGEVVILNILHHLFSSGTDTSDRVYTTSKNTILSLKDQIADFLTLIGDKLNLRNFPAHAELRVDEQGVIRPIEINPLRFGGWCTTSDLLGIGLGLNAYESFFQSNVPDWDALFAGKEDKTYSIIVLNNNSGIAPEEITGFDYAKLATDFENPIEIREIDIQAYPLFGFVFAETSESRRQELQEMLTSDLRKYIVRKGEN
jgi:hypothetical protein